MLTTNTYVLTSESLVLHDADSSRYGNRDLREYVKALYELLVVQFSKSPRSSELKKILDELLRAQELLDESRQ